MLLSLGLGSMFGTVEGVVTPLFDIGLKIPKVALTGKIIGNFISSNLKTVKSCRIATNDCLGETMR